MIAFKICLISWVCFLATYGSPTNVPNDPHLNPVEGKSALGPDNRVDDSFHFQSQTLDGITSGCYGHSGNQVTYYIADAAGYRVVQPLQSVLVVVGDANAAPQIRTWQQLEMPEACGQQMQPSAQHTNAQSDVHSGPSSTTRPGFVNVPVGVVTGALMIMNSITGGPSGAVPGGVQNDLGLGGILNVPISLLNGLIGIVNGVLGGLVSSLAG